MSYLDVLKKIRSMLKSNLKSVMFSIEINFLNNAHLLQSTQIRIPAGKRLGQPNQLHFLVFL